MLNAYGLLELLNKSVGCAAGENDCAITDQVMMTCDSIGALMGGYRPILGEACYRYQACSICVSSFSTGIPCKLKQSVSTNSEWVTALISVRYSLMRLSC